MLLDTNVVSELFRPQLHPHLLAWFRDSAPEALFLCSVTHFELLVG